MTSYLLFCLPLSLAALHGHSVLCDVPLFMQFTYDNASVDFKLTRFGGAPGDVELVTVGRWAVGTCALSLLCSSCQPPVPLPLPCLTPPPLAARGMRLSPGSCPSIMPHPIHAAGGNGFQPAALVCTDPCVFLALAAAASAAAAADSNAASHW